MSTPHQHDPDSLARAYLAWHRTGDDARYGWAESELFKLSLHAPETLFAVVLALAAQADSDADRIAVGGGPLQALLEKHPSFGAAVAREAQANPRLFACLLHVWPENLQYELWLWLTQLQEARGFNT